MLPVSSNSKTLHHNHHHRSHALSRLRGWLRGKSTSPHKSFTSDSCSSSSLSRKWHKTEQDQPLPPLLSTSCPPESLSQLQSPEVEAEVEGLMSCVNKEDTTAGSDTTTGTAPETPAPSDTTTIPVGLTRDEEEIITNTTTAPGVQQQFETLDLNETETDAVTVQSESVSTSLTGCCQSLEDSWLIPHAVTRPLSSKSSQKAAANATHLLKLHLVSGKDLVIRDSSGTSDPYVKIRHQGVSLARSRIIPKQLNPMWNEIFVLPLSQVTVPLELRIYDHDRVGRDDYMGRALLYLHNMPLDEMQEFHLTLEDETGKSSENYLGMLNLFCCLMLNTQPSTVPNSSSRSDLQQSSPSPSSSTPFTPFSSSDIGTPGVLGDWSSTTNVRNTVARRRLEKTGSLHSSDPTTQSNRGSTACLSTSGVSRRLGGGNIGGTSRRQNTAMAVVTLVVMSAEGLLPLEADNPASCNPYVKFRLGKESCRTKVARKTTTPQWHQHFSLQIGDHTATTLEFRLYSNEVTSQPFLGRGSLDLSRLPHEKAQVFLAPLEDCAGFLRLQITVTYHEDLAGLDLSLPYCDLDGRFQRDALLHRYSLRQTLADIKDVGWLQVKVIRAENLMAKDLNGKSDPFCVVQLVNERVQTRTEYKTLNPDWNENFQFEVRDIHEQLQVTLFDEDKDKRDFLGRVEIPLLTINNGERRWYALKNEKLTRKTRGAVLLEMHFIYNHIRAAVKTLEPRDVREMTLEGKVSLQTLVQTLRQNIDRIRIILDAFIITFQFLESCWSWKSPSRTIIAFMLFLVIVWNFELYMLPFTLVLLFLKALIFQALGNKFASRFGASGALSAGTGGTRAGGGTSSSRSTATDQTGEGAGGSDSNRPLEAIEEESLLDDEEEDKIEKEKSSSFMEYFNSAKDILVKVQDTTDAIASVFERVYNVFQWEVPWLSCLAIVLFVLISLVLYLVPLRWLVLAWGINKFTKKILRPRAMDNFEPLDFLSRVPNSIELGKWRDLLRDSSSSSTASSKFSGIGSSTTSPSPTVSNKKRN